MFSVRLVAVFEEDEGWQACPEELQKKEYSQIFHNIPNSGLRNYEVAYSILLQII